MTFLIIQNYSLFFSIVTALTKKSPYPLEKYREEEKEYELAATTKHPWGAARPGKWLHMTGFLYVTLKVVLVFGETPHAQEAP